MILDMNREELKRFELVACLDAQLMGAEKTMEPRLRTIPNGWRDYRMVMTRLGQLVEAIYQTMPDKAVKHMVNLLRHGEAIVRIKPIDSGHYLQPIDVRDLRVLVNLAVEAECFGCSKGRAEIKGCELRKVLMVATPPSDVNLGECPYRYVADNYPVGKYL